MMSLGHSWWHRLDVNYEFTYTFLKCFKTQGKYRLGASLERIPHKIWQPSLQFNEHWFQKTWFLQKSLFVHFLVYIIFLSRYATCPNIAIRTFNYAYITLYTFYLSYLIGLPAQGNGCCGVWTKTPDECRRLWTSFLIVFGLWCLQ